MEMFMKKLLILFGLLYFGSMPIYSREPFDFFHNLEKKLFPLQDMNIPQQTFEHNFWKELVKTMLLLIFWSATIFPVKFGDCFAHLVVELGVALRLIERVPESDECDEVK